MHKYYLSFCNEQRDWEVVDIVGSDNLRHMTSEARDLQRILPQERKEANCYYAVLERGGALRYSAGGY